MADSLWPEFSPANINDPKVIIEEQAKILPKHTNEKVIAIVEKSAVNTLDIHNHGHYSFIYNFKITGKMLPSYNFIAFVFSYDLPVYPLEVTVDWDISREIGLEDDTITINNEGELIDLLKLIFRSKKITDIVSSIMKLT